MKHTSIAVLACLFMVSAAHAQIPGGGFTTSAIAQLEYSAIPSTAIGTDGLALIAYRSPQGVVVAHCSNPACSVAVATVVDNAAVPYNSPIVIGSDGRGLVSHGDGGITVAHCNDVACTSATTTLLDPGGGGWVAATVGADGLGLVAYPRGAFGPLTVAHCSNAACSAATFSTFGQFTDIHTPAATEKEPFKAAR